MDKVDEVKIVAGDAAGEEKGVKIPRVTIQFCTQCKWMLRAAYFAQELLSTFGTDIGEVALQPSTGGTFVVELFTNANANKNAIGHVESGESVGEVKVLKHTLWDRKSEGGFPETKELKKRLRDIIDPSRDLGHVDGNKSSSSASTSQPTEAKPEEVKEKKQDEEEVTLNERGKIVITGLEGEGGFGVCIPGGECGGF